MKRAALSLYFLLLLAAPAGAAEELATAAGRIQADAYGGHIAWAQLDASTKKWQLVEHHEGKVRRLPVDAFSGPVRLDLGPGPEGGTVAVYAREGKLHLYDFGSREERELFEFGFGLLPSVWRGELFFARRTAGRFDLWRGKFGTGRLAKLQGGPVSGTSGPIATEMRGGRAVYVWQSRKKGRVETELYEVVDDRAVLRDRTGSTARSTSTFVTPEIHGSRAYYGRATVGRPGQELRRVSLTNGRVEMARAPFGPLVTALFTSGSRFLLSRVKEEGDTGIEECGMDGESSLSESICRLVLGDPVSDWTRLRSGGSR